MRPISVSDPESDRALLQQEINRHQDARYDHRLHCVSLVAAGIPCEQVALYFGDSPRSVVNWVRRFDRPVTPMTPPRFSTAAYKLDFGP
jgi:transposase